MNQVTWTSPVTSQLLLEAGCLDLHQPVGLDGAAGRHHQPEPGAGAVALTSLSTTQTYRALDWNFNRMH